ncbi:FabG Dehydrogenase with different specificities related to short-chain alcohol dehydrogenase [Pyrenophora tritici-repentis]|uniref:FabG, Dehydrogenase with different specificities (Related to short-chain alcohol dehydrogenase) n=2 Tax=Pyrenophora tritici-repentis TaxID=45151 RepID=A0A2W1FRK6_9PLEO|nr:retinol dehydrogenase 13 [Pyrenophora tritici-repentis Pt-1C-BFP]KAF7448793.1 Retinol dehydrogenase 13 [Pyrenophora tritici-repentis]EDU45970.1 retinol dehydrogenase 13 [Pyrenophora tritici-repentis Pt-1C-BFP]KAF7571205.1 FabG, Dehydrogenase with different specificities (related to short-chain alcohol dehydrogenase) [Pyrenophora tritici-repentis]KAG9384254.1 Retinol dehydrogenase 13 [Pyrenophora tritici-repentis]KAI0569370.1 Retinol dehydrogenase 13 [Pyrenophora tritici-repentis]
MASLSAKGIAKSYASVIQGKVILTTGVSPSGLGAAFLKAIAALQPALLILAGRNISKVKETASQLAAENPTISIKSRILQLDLSSLEAVRTAANTVNSWSDVPHIDVLVNNAGIMATDYALSPEGYESQFATNHLGPFLFTNLIMGKLQASAAPRVVMVSSDGHRLGSFRFDDYNFHHGETYNRWQAYGQSKTANMLMAIALAEKLGAKHNLLSFSLHPGVIGTGLGDHIDWNVEYLALQKVDRFMGNAEGWNANFDFVSHDEGSATHVVAAFDTEISGRNGAYLEKGEIVADDSNRIKPWATSRVEAEKLWKLSEGLVGQTFSY